MFNDPEDGGGLFKRDVSEYYLHPNTVISAEKKKTKKLFIHFPTSYLLGRGLSAVNYSLPAKRNRPENTEDGDSGLQLTKLAPGIKEICRMYQTYGSH